MIFIPIIAILFLIFLLGLITIINTSSQNAYETIVDKNGDILLRQKHSIYLKTDSLSKLVVQFYSAVRVIWNAWKPDFRKISSNNIVTKLHQERFGSKEPYLSTGDHFIDLYVRDYGIFYEAVLDPRIITTKTDWMRRQKIMLKTVALHLDLLAQSSQPYTTYMSLRPNVFVGVNIWTTPSDALFSVLFTLASLTNEEFLLSTFPSKKRRKYQLQTKKQGILLIQQYSEILQFHIKEFLEKVIDSKTQLVRKDIFLSGTRDHIKRESAFYDNVVTWATVKLASELNIHKVSKNELIKWKNHIIKNFWNEEEGIFIDDLTKESKVNNIFCADSLVILITRFLDPVIKEDRNKLERIIVYVKKNNLDFPFPLLYAKKDQPKKMYLISRILFPSYIGESIFSHWGIEFIKLVILVNNYNKNYVQDINKYFKDYNDQIIRYGGYPEIYDKKGNLFRTFLYRSALHTGWIINFEQAKMLYSQK